MLRTVTGCLGNRALLGGPEGYAGLATTKEIPAEPTEATLLFVCSKDVLPKQ